MPPLTPSKTRAIGRSRRGLEPVLVAELAVRQLFEGYREVILARLGVHHRGRILAEAAFADVVVVAVDLAGALCGDDHRRIVRVGVLEQSVDAWMDHGSDSTSSARTTRSSSLAARSSSSLTTW